MRSARFGVWAALLLLVSTAVAQQPSAKDLIQGKWVMSEKKEGGEVSAYMNFAEKKATMKLVLKMGDKVEEVTIEAKYTWVPGQAGVADDTIEMTTRPPGAKEDQSERVKIKVSDKELIMSGKDGKALTFTRDKQ